MVHAHPEKKIEVKRYERHILIQNVRDQLSKPQNFIGDGSICKERMWQHISNHLKFVPINYEVISWQQAKFQVLWAYFSFSNFRKESSSFFELGFGYNMFFACFPY